ncbi:cobalamin biosynthesis protein CbiX [Paenirhodobacter sp.]|uniref:cobalamin biosynthesis protein CbiX n=1 Tax=Paenirhodobacter sp. TaxID=1965326 RepID=UPI003B3D708E
MKTLAEQVAVGLGMPVRAATLAKPGALEATGTEPALVYPLFMAEGWFTRRELPRRLSGRSVRILPPFGLEPELPELVRHIVLTAAKSHGIDPRGSDLILAAHGSRVPSRAKDTTFTMAAFLRRSTPFWRILPAFVEEPPHIADVAALSRGGLCLPFFALRAGHVLNDLPTALAGFAGPLLPPVGEHPDVPALIARSLARAWKPSASQ